MRFRLLVCALVASVCFACTYKDKSSAEPSPPTSPTAAIIGTVIIPDENEVSQLVMVRAPDGHDYIVVIAHHGTTTGGTGIAFQHAEGCANAKHNSQ